MQLNKAIKTIALMASCGFRLLQSVKATRAKQNKIGIANCKLTKQKVGLD
jgi:hypothetical protein